jgi:hypothetical protein
MIMLCQSSLGILLAIVAVGLMAGYYVYNLIDADGVVRYVGKGTGRRFNSHLGVILALAAGAPATRASKVHRRFAADIQIGRQFRAAVVADGLSQADAYAMEAHLIAKHRRETEGGTLWNVLAGGEGFQGILREDWILVARQAAATKELSGSGLRAGAKAAATKALTGSGLRAGAKAAATKLKQLQRPPPG